MTDRDPAAVPSVELGSLTLLKIPYVFTQDSLLDTGGFMRAAKERGTPLSLSGLQRLHELGVLVPLYRVDDDVDPGLTADATTTQTFGHNPTGWVFAAGREGRQRDPAIEGFRADRPYERPPDAGDASEQWWNGYVYSPWQLLDLEPIVNEHEWIRGGVRPRLAAASELRLDPVPAVRRPHRDSPGAPRRPNRTKKRNRHH